MSKKEGEREGEIERDREIERERERTGPSKRVRKLLRNS